MDAVVENAATPPSRFYCHTCAVEIDNVSSEFTCPRCSQGFIEELPAVDRSSSSGPPDYSFEDQASDYPANPQLNEQALRLAGELFSNAFLTPFFRHTNDARDGEPSGASSGASNGDRAMFLLEDIPLDGANHLPGASGAGGGGAGGGGGGVPIGVDTGEGGAASSSAGGSASGGGSVTLFGGDPRPSMRFPGRRGSRRRGLQNINHVDHILREILISVSGGSNGAGGPLFFMGNPGDYAWGREGIDTIVTQLLNQMDNTGPPPLEKERIAEIPTVTINSEQVERKLQCSVCFEDFVLDEAVRKLPCLHVYHEPCIIPWLELHGTCPICRKSLTPEQSQASPQSQSQQTQQDHSAGTPPEETAEQHNRQATPQDQQAPPARRGQQQQQQQQQASSGQAGDRQNPNILTLTIRDLFPFLSGAENVLYEVGQPQVVSTSSLPQAPGTPAGGAADSSSRSSSSSSIARRPNPAGPSPSSASGSAAAATTAGSDQPTGSGNSNRDDDGNIDYTLDLD